MPIMIIKIWILYFNISLNLIILDQGYDDELDNDDADEHSCKLIL